MLKFHQIAMIKLYELLRSYSFLQVISSSNDGTACISAQFPASRVTYSPNIAGKPYLQCSSNGSEVILSLQGDSVMMAEYDDNDKPLAHLLLKVGRFSLEVLAKK